MTLTINIRTTIPAPAGLEQMVADALEEIFDAQQKSGNDHFFVEVNGRSSATAIWSDRWRLPSMGGDTGFINPELERQLAAAEAQLAELKAIVKQK